MCGLMHIISFGIRSSKRRVLSIGWGGSILWLCFASMEEVVSTKQKLLQASGSVEGLSKYFCFQEGLGTEYTSLYGVHTLWA